MKLVILEGPVDLQFFKSFIIKQMSGRDVANRYKNLIIMFKNLIAENPEMARVDVLSIGDEVLTLQRVKLPSLSSAIYKAISKGVSTGDDMLILLSVGSKSNFRIIAESIKPLIGALRKEGHYVYSILFIADKDAEPEVMDSESSIRRKLEREGWEIDIRHILYDDYLEDLILEIVGMIAKKSPENINIELLNNLLSIIEERYRNDRYLLKRKIGIVHAIIGPRCFGHLFDEIFQFFDNLDHLIQLVNVLSEFNNWLKK